MPLHKNNKLTGIALGRKERTMNEKEKKELYIATCKCCLLAQEMKDCTLCQFNIGLAEKAQPAVPIPVSLPIRIDLFALSEQQ
jgi:hypothetical protein